MKIQQRIYASLLGAAPWASLVFGVVIAVAMIHVGFAQARVQEQVAEVKRLQMLQQIAFDEREISCLANIVYHEARGEISDVRKLIGGTVLAIAGDPGYGTPNEICKLAKVRGFFSNLKDAVESHFANSLWVNIYNEMDGVYNGSRKLPRGWACVRAFRASDDYLVSLQSRALAQLGFTVNAKGLKYFASDLVPVDTRGHITFYSPRGGCSNPTQTL